MPRKANSPPQEPWSYERACAALHAEPFIADPDPLPASVDFDQDDALDQVRRAAARPLARPQLVAYPVAGVPGRAQVVARFAGTLLLERRAGGRLVPASSNTRPLFRERANLQWIYWGELNASPSGQLTISTLSVGPWPGADSTLEPGADPFQGVTTDVLRALKPARIISQAVEKIRALDQTHRFLTDHYGWAEPPAQRRLLEQAAERVSRPQLRRGRRYPDEHYRSIALLYLDLLDQGGQRKIVARLADQLDIPRTTARDWVHRARVLGYLTASRQGRAGAEPGPRLREESSDAFHVQPNPQQAKRVRAPLGK